MSGDSSDVPYFLKKIVAATNVSPCRYPRRLYEGGYNLRCGVNNFQTLLSAASMSYLVLMLL